MVILAAYGTLDRLAQIVSNLVANALKHGVAGGPVQVEIDGSAATQVKLAVRNPGTIPPEILPEIFEPFRGKSMRDSSSDGLGLGLFIVERLVKAHEGTIEVRSERDETCSRFSCPGSHALRRQVCVEGTDRRALRILRCHEFFAGRAARHRGFTVELRRHDGCSAYPTWTSDAFRFACWSRVSPAAAPRRIRRRPPQRALDAPRG